MNLSSIFAFLFLVAGCSTNKVIKNKMFHKLKGEKYQTPNGYVDVEMLFREKDGSHNYVGRGHFKPGSIVPEHIHASSDEYLIFYQGAGTLVIDGKEHQVEDGSAFHIPKSIPHSYSNRSRKKGVFVQIYSPAGPEVKFTKWISK